MPVGIDLVGDVAGFAVEVAGFVVEVVVDGRGNAAEVDFVVADFGMMAGDDCVVAEVVEDTDSVADCSYHS